MFQLIVKVEGRVIDKFVCETEVTTIGRERTNDVVIENISVSRTHVQIREDQDKYIVSDLGSTNGTFLNDARLLNSEIKDGDVLKLGKVELEFQKEEKSETFVFDIDKTVMTRPADQAPQEDQSHRRFMASINAQVFHMTSCEWKQGISEFRRVYYSTREEEIAAGKRPCKLCNP